MLTKLRRRFILDTMILALIILIGATSLLIVASYTYGQNAALDTMKDLLASVTPEVVTVTEGEKGKPDSAEVDWEAIEIRDESAIMILSEDGDVLVSVVPGKSFREKVAGSQAEIARAVSQEKKSSGIILTNIRYMKEPLKGIGTKVALLDRASELKAIYFQFRLYITLAFILLILLLLLGEYLARRSILPVDEAIRTQQQFIADASHELKTPIAVILANLDILKTSPDKTVRESEKWIESTKLEANRMSKLVNEMLFLARSDAAMDMHYNFRLINFSDVVEEVVLTTEALIFERNVTLETDIEEDSQVVGDIERLKQVVMILIENATKYVDENGTIRVKLTSGPRHMEVLTVTNSGAPIPKEKAEHIFERFYRVDESRVREKGGYGLGLSIAQKIIEKHHGEIGLAFSNENGTCFVVRLPHAQNLRAPDLTVLPGTDAAKEKPAD